MLTCLVLLLVLLAFGTLLTLAVVALVLPALAVGALAVADSAKVMELATPLRDLLLKRQA